ncbi:N-acetylmuramoyl-L-alanine amidase [Leptospira yasudae]|uniref:N-acetylmuramoyl-L-alanine amidase n=1 Tax=Leptospira yasudae TaxID=2202201 RepID=A0ABX9M1U6_9LEPT|nr:N-acetylmuramoyl-L-alanine amidase [Leptospira yasudae]RHX79440.1 N-acetylmuramoyl-L-alanine amidase [Leptospira yasudae]RHX95764.1 N-acetylmuramoyl-L-alanine amidase [Leptospira yasudae]TGK29572.1 N-acetylmuramoyl-L-alanine amidase [Leptospira yasudae]TGM07802.1 N-acetylmuramoyl-L-alanine amidase [Leptospira yasudae]
MAKNQIYLWGLILFFSNAWGLAAKVSIPTQASERYVRFEDVQKEFPSLKSSFNPATFVGSIKHPSGEIRFRVGSSFYTFNQTIEKISVPILYKEKDFLIPPEIVEALFVQLMSEDVRYEYKENVLELEVLPGAETLGIKTVLIDAGHGGKDPGTASNDGTNEKSVALQVAKILKKFFEKVYPEIEVVLTRPDDTFVELEQRSAIANRELKKKGSALFISLHCNSSINEDVNGFEIYYLSQTASTESARETALLENRILKPKGTSAVKRIQAGMMSSLIQRRSRILARSLESEMKKKLQPQILSRGVKKADFSVLRGSLMPAVLVEMGYLSHEKESKLLQSKSLQVKIAKSIVEGIRGYELAKN